MILANLRASAWKYGCIAVAVLAVAAAITATVFHIQNLELSSDYDAAKRDRDSARAEVVSLNQARERDESSAALTTEARTTVDAATAVSDTRATQIEVRYRDRVVQVPAACPSPDPDLMRDLAAQTARVLAAEDRLRRVGRAPKEGAR